MYLLEPDSLETSSGDDDLDILIKAREKAAQQHLQSFIAVISTSNNAMQKIRLWCCLTTTLQTSPDWKKTEMFCDTGNNFKN